MKKKCMTETSYPGAALGVNHFRAATVVTGLDFPSTG